MRYPFPCNDLNITSSSWEVYMILYFETRLKLNSLTQPRQSVVPTNNESYGVEEGFWNDVGDGGASVNVYFLLLRSPGGSSLLNKYIGEGVCE